MNREQSNYYYAIRIWKLFQYIFVFIYFCMWIEIYLLPTKTKIIDFDWIAVAKEQNAIDITTAAIDVEHGTLKEK